MASLLRQGPLTAPVGAQRMSQVLPTVVQPTVPRRAVLLRATAPPCEAGPSEGSPFSDEDRWLPKTHAKAPNMRVSAIVPPPPPPPLPPAAWAGADCG